MAHYGSLNTTSKDVGPKYSTIKPIELNLASLGGSNTSLYTVASLHVAPIKNGDLRGTKEMIYSI